MAKTETKPEDKPKYDPKTLAEIEAGRERVAYHQGIDKLRAERTAEKAAADAKAAENNQEL